MNNPFCKRSTLDRAIADHRKKVSAINREHERELSETKKEVSELVNKLTQVTMTPNGDRSRFRLCIDIDERLVRDSLAWGNDNHVIDYYAEMISDQIKRELRSMNLVRYREEAFCRGYGGVDFKEAPFYSREMR